jgi:hypothetical protein
MKSNRAAVRVAQRLIVLALLMAGLSSRGNVVGYVNLYITNGYNFVADQLQNFAGYELLNNDLNFIIGPPTNNPVPPGTKVYVWDVTNQVFLPPSTYSTQDVSWVPDYIIPVGNGFVIWSDTNWVLTTFGEVREGALSTFVAGQHKFSLLATMVPIGSTSISGTVFRFPHIDGADAYLFSTPNQSFSDAFSCFDGLGWFDPNHLVGTDGPAPAVGQPFFIRNPGADTNWIFSFQVQLHDRMKPAGAPGASAPQIVNLQVSSGLVSLNIVNPAGGPYDVQFSTDGLAWTTIASHQTGSVWKGPPPGGGRQGYYQVIAP